MTPIVEAALRDSLAKAFAVDADICHLPEFADAVAGVKVETNGAVDEASVAAAVSEMQRRKPGLFAPWETLGHEAFLEREAAFRQGLRQPRPIGPNPFRDLDAARLTHDEMHSLTRAVSGFASTLDRAVLTRALVRQRQEDAAITPAPDAA